MTAFASLDDIEVVWRPLSDQEASAADVLLARISALMRVRVAGLDTRVGADVDLATVARGVAVDAVLRVLRNPEGKVSESIDDYTYRRADAVSDGSLYVSDVELALLRPVAPLGTARKSSVRLMARGYEPRDPSIFPTI